MECRSCGGACSEVLTLGPQVPANRFIPEADLGKPEPRYDLTVCLCEDCGLAQLRTLVPAEELFSHYRWRTGNAPALLTHLKQIAQQYGGPGKFVVEIGSNDGALLRAFKATGSRVLGIDPAANLAALANAEGLTTRTEFFGKGTVLPQPADVIVARNVIAHVPDSHGLLDAVAKNLKPDGVFLVETPWVASHFQNADVGSFYHEHGIYLGIQSFTTLLKPHDLGIADCRIVNIHGGSLLAEVRRNPDRQSAEVIAYEEREFRMGVYNPTGWQDFYEDASEGLARFKDALRERRGHVAGYAAAAKGMVLLQWGSIGPDLLPVIYDHTPEKGGLYTPSTHIPVVFPDRLKDSKARWLAVLAFNWLDEIRKDPTLTRFGMFSTDGRLEGAPR